MRAALHLARLPRPRAAHVDDEEAAHFLQEAKQAGVDRFYLVGGFDPITMRAFTGKDQKAWDHGVEAIKKAWDAGIEPYTSFLLGGDQDDEGTVDRMLEFAEVSGIRKAEFAVATPYPGTPQWHALVAQDRILTRDWSKYNDANVVLQPAQMTVEQVQDGYLRLWRELYASRGHLAEQPVGSGRISSEAPRRRMKRAGYSSAPSWQSDDNSSQ